MSLTSLAGATTGSANATAVLGRPGHQRFWEGLAVVLAAGSAIAALAPFDVVFAAATRGSAPLRVCAFVALASLGAFFGTRVGLKIRRHGSKHPALIGLGAAIGIAGLVWMTDFLFRNILPNSYVEFLRMGLWDRLLYFMLRAFNENVFYRLFLFSLLAFLLGKVLHNDRGLPTASAFLIAMVAAQIINISLNVGFASPPTVAMIAYDVVRYIVPGVTWAALYWRFGFATAEIASVTCHVFLQPPLGYLLAT